MNIQIPAADRVVSASDNMPADPVLAHKANIEGLYEESKLWADGAVIETQEQADAVERLLDMIDEAYAAANASREAEKKPLDEQVAAIQAKYAPLIADNKSVTGLTVRAKTALLATLTVWKNKLQAARDAETARLQAIADAKAEEARKAAHAVDQTDLAQTEAAEQLIRDAQTASRVATKAATNTVKGTRTVWDVTIADKKKATLAMLQRHPDECLAFFLQLAEGDVRLRSIRTIDGFTIKSRKVAT